MGWTVKPSAEPPRDGAVVSFAPEVSRIGEGDLGEGKGLIVNPSALPPEAASDFRYLG